ncbi:unnamed protein product [Prorocentrum cordatum]|uniref:Phospholipase B-like n=1 Tax=Prorocentrum cordatum TaxID=2364126 RepID=A0ABN9YJJ0_9DINO|nr:unnamed protein product [Polarella glacialis]
MPLRELVEVQANWHTNVLAKIVMNTWCGPRTIRSGRNHSLQPLHATNGLPADDCNADPAIKVHAEFEMDIFVARCFTIEPLKYIDGSAIGNCPSDITTAKRTAVESMQEFKAASGKLNAVLN